MNKNETPNHERKDATEETKQVNQAFSEQLPLDNRGSFELALKGFLKPIPGDPLTVQVGTGNEEKSVTVWDPHRFDFIKEDAQAPDTVNPNLWHQSKLTKIGGLFKVVDGIYQVRNYDLANMTIIESNSGIILVDVLTCAETAKASLELYYDWKEKRPPVKAVIITHSHVDHFAGIIDGVTTMNDIEEGNVKVIAPHGFVNAVAMENFYMGNVMGRRASYMYGSLLPADVKGDVGVGLGSAVANGTVTMVPWYLITKIKKDFKELPIDGVDFTFQLTPGTEAPAEMHFFVEQYNALCTAENAVHTMHNVYSLRGAQIRDALAWSKDLNTALNLWGDKAEVYFGVHHWPVWGKENVVTYLKKQRDIYRYINDQTLRLANLGYKPVEIAEELRSLPHELEYFLENDGDLQGYYGSLNHNVKSVYVKHIGWFDGNPADLHPYPPCETGEKYVQFMGGPEKLMKNARASFDKGDYRWVVQVMNHLVFADPGNTDARKLQADALEQLGYQSESGPWRNFYLSGAMELRDGVQTIPEVPPSFILSVPTDIFFDYMGMLLKGWEARNEKAVFDIHFNVKENISTDKKMEGYRLEIENGVINHSDLKTPYSTPDLTISTTREIFYNLIAGIAGGIIKDPTAALNQLIEEGDISVHGDGIGKFRYILEHLQVMNPGFNIVEPVEPGV